MQRYNGNYSDYAEKVVSVSDAAEKPKKAAEKKERVFVGEKKLKFSYKEQREFETIESDIEELENRIAELEAEMMANASSYGKLSELTKEKEEKEALLEQKMERWEYLTELSEKIEAQKS